MKSIYDRLNDEDQYLDAIDEAIDIIGEMRVIIRCAVALNKDGLSWGENSEFQKKINAIMQRTKP